jgi:ectoine hydroxylase-related dioxygenase (phytanoyl-CoA dioxygenase family)
MILKPPHVGGELPWHQDEAYWDTGFRYRALGSWMPLDPATRESGCMHFLPGSHLGPVRPHRHLEDDPRVHGLVTDGVDARGQIAVPLDPGGASFHHCRTLHRTPPNASGRVRRAWANELQLEPVPLAADDEPDRPWVRAGKVAWKGRRILAGS